MGFHHNVELDSLAQSVQLAPLIDNNKYYLLQYQTVITKRSEVCWFKLKSVSQLNFKRYRSLLYCTLNNRIQNTKHRARVDNKTHWTPYIVVVVDHITRLTHAGYLSYRTRSDWVRHVHAENAILSMHTMHSRSS